jgi:hypothetical protein
VDIGACDPVAAPVRTLSPGMEPVYRAIAAHDMLAMMAPAKAIFVAVCTAFSCLAVTIPG